MSASAARRRRWPLVLAVVVVLLVIGVVVADLVVREATRARVAALLQQSIALDVEPEVEIGGFSVLAQLLSGRLDSVVARVDDARIGQVEASVRVQARGVPVDGAGELDAATAELVVSPEEVRRLVTESAPGAVGSVELADDAVRLSSELNVLGLRVPLALTVEPSLDGSTLVLRPTTIEAGGLSYTAEQAEEQFGPVAEGVTSGVRVCLADRIPAGISPTAIDVSAEGLRVTADIDRRILADPALAAPGTC